MYDGGAEPGEYPAVPKNNTSAARVGQLRSRAEECAQGGKDKGVGEGAGILQVSHPLVAAVSLRFFGGEPSPSNWPRVYTYELLERNHIETVRETQTSTETLRRLEVSIGASLLQLGADVQQIVQQDVQQHFAAETRQVQEYMASEIASLRRDFISWTNETQRVIMVSL